MFARCRSVAKGYSPGGLVCVPSETVYHRRIMSDGDAQPPRGASEVRSALILAAMRRLEEVPPAKLSLQAVADDAGVNRGLIHRHFGSKAALLAAVMYQIRDDYLDELDPNASVLDLLFLPIKNLVQNPVMGRILIWMTSEEIDPDVFGAGYPLIRQSEHLLAAAGVDNPTAVIGHQLSAAYGWIMFETNMMHALGQDEVEQARDQFLAYARSVLEREVGTEGS